jgi:competence protein ComEC
MAHWAPYPLLRLFPPFALGILASQHMAVVSELLFIPAVALMMVFSFYVFFLARIISYKTRWIFGILTFMLVFFLSSAWTMMNAPGENHEHILNQGPLKPYSLIRICSYPQEREKSIKAEAEWIWNGDTAQLINCSGKLILYMARDSVAKGFSYGDLLLISRKPQPVQPPANPEAFDYRKWLLRQGITHQVWLPSGSAVKVGEGDTRFVYRIAFAMRQAMLEALQKCGLEGKEFAVAAALLLGYTDKLDPDLRQEYAGTGAMHILSVSGMHVGLVFVVINTLLLFMERIKHGKYIRAVLIILLIWMYAFITGLSPSVLRASSMFSMIMIGRLMMRHHDMFNTMAGSAWILLIINPSFLFDLGFQLSYLALAGIAGVHPMIVSWWKPRYWLPRQVWSIVSVSLAAQLTTAPISLYYFHQFPNYFLLTNIVALPLSSLVMYAGLATLALSPVPYLSEWLGTVLYGLVYALNYCIALIEGLPGSVSRGFGISLAENLLLYAVMFAFLIFAAGRKRPWLMASICLLLIFCASFSLRRMEQHRQAFAVVYAVKGHSAIDLVSGRQRFLVANREFMADHRTITFHTGNLMALSGVSDYYGASWEEGSFNDPATGVFKHKQLCCFRGKTCLRLTETPRGAHKQHVDLLILSENIRADISLLVDNFSPELIIIDASCSRYRAEQWMKACREAGVPCRSLQHSGAFLIRF